jgi:hypothetical protein
MSQQKQQLLRRELTVSQILREYGKKFTQITERYSDGRNGRCAMGVIMSYFGWNGRDENYAGSKLLGTLIALRRAGIDKNLLIELNDSGYTFNEIADYLDRSDELTDRNSQFIFSASKNNFTDRILFEIIRHLLSFKNLERL